MTGFGVFSSDSYTDRSWRSIQSPAALNLYRRQIPGNDYQEIAIHFISNILIFFVIILYLTEASQFQAFIWF
jgi:hypothetical protein